MRALLSDERFLRVLIALAIGAALFGPSIAGGYAPW